MDAALSFLDSPKQANKRQFPLAENLSVHLLVEAENLPSRADSSSNSVTNHNAGGGAT